MLKNWLVICDENKRARVTALAGEANARFITSHNDLESVAFEDAACYDYILVFAELVWDKHVCSDFFGIDVAVSLRLRLKMIAPICIISFMPKAYFYGLDDVKYNILKARGTIFVQLPRDPFSQISDFDNTLPLSKATLVYLSNLLVDVKHLVDLFRHELRMYSAHDTICRSLKRIDLLTSISIYPRVKALAAEIISAHAAGDEDLFYKLTKDMVNTLNMYAQESTCEKLNQNENRNKILLVDDNPTDLHWATSNLEKYFEVVAFQDVLAAKQYIDEDASNEILAIICDWQLLKANTDEHQCMLGFELLQYASQKGHYALFSLTSTDDNSTREVDQFLNFEHTLIIKDFHYDEFLWKMYIPIIQQKIDRNTELLASLPTGETWTNNFKLDYRKEEGKKIPYKKYFKSYAQQYIEQRNSTFWHSYENEISAIATQLWQYYENAFVSENCPMLFDLKSQWGIELNHELKNVLLIRRLYLAFWFNKTKLNIGFTVPQKGWVEDPIINIYSVLRHRYFNDISDERGGIDDEKTFKDLNNSAKVFVNQLALEPGRLPQGMLPEEKAWLQNIGIDVKTGNDNLYNDDL